MAKGRVGLALLDFLRDGDTAQKSDVKKTCFGTIFGFFGPFFPKNRRKSPDFCQF